MAASDPTGPTVDHPKSSPGYGKTTVSCAAWPVIADPFGYLALPRHRQIAHFVDRLPDGACMSVKVLRGALPRGIGLMTVGAALNALSVGGNLRRVQDQLDDGRTVTRTYWSRKRLTDDEWDEYLRDVQPVRGKAVRPALRIAAADDDAVGSGSAAASRVAQRVASQGASHEVPQVASRVVAVAVPEGASQVVREVASRVVPPVEFEAGPQEARQVTPPAVPSPGLAAVAPAVPEATASEGATEVPAAVAGVPAVAPVDAEIGEDADAPAGADDPAEPAASASGAATAAPASGAAAAPAADPAPSGTADASTEAADPAAAPAPTAVADPADPASGAGGAGETRRTTPAWPAVAVPGGGCAARPRAAKTQEAPASDAARAVLAMVVRTDPALTLSEDELTGLARTVDERLAEGLASEEIVSALTRRYPMPIWSPGGLLRKRLDALRPVAAGPVAAGPGTSGPGVPGSAAPGPVGLRSAGTGAVGTEPAGTGAFAARGHGGGRAAAGDGAWERPGVPSPRTVNRRLACTSCGILHHRMDGGLCPPCREDHERGVPHIPLTPEQTSDRVRQVRELMRAHRPDPRRRRQ